MRYRDIHELSVSNPRFFWRQKSDLIEWFRKPQEILTEDVNGLARWYEGGLLNTCHLALDRHVDGGRGEQVALFWDSPAAGERRRRTYRELRDDVARFAGALQGLGVAKGDRVVVYMPMIPEAVVAMLACARLGAVHSVVFGGFAPHELAVRIDDVQPRLLITASCGFEASRVVAYKPLVDAALAEARFPPPQVIVFARPQVAAALAPGRDLDWHELVERAEPAACVPVAATDPLYILYTAGTTGRPKGVVRDNGGHAVALRYSLKAIYNTNPGEVFWAASDVGWVVGHSYIVYGPLIHGCSTVLFEGKPVRTPDAGAYWRVIQDYGVSALLAAPTAFRAIRLDDPDAHLRRRYDISTLRSVFLTGERLDPATFEWLNLVLDVPIVDHWWQTETGWPVAANPMGLEPHTVKTGSVTLPVPGFRVAALDDAGTPVAPGKPGHLCLELPLPPGCLTGLWNDSDGFRETYLAAFPGYVRTADGGHLDEDGYVFVAGRTDDVITVAGHRLSTGGMEEILASHPAVAECAVVGIDDPLKGQVPIGLVVLRAGTAGGAAQIEADLVQLIRREIGAVAALRQVIVVARLPKTRTGTILRATIRRLAVEEQIVTPPAIEDPAIVAEIRAALREHRVGQYASQSLAADDAADL
ncbi:MAG TPA: AMP-binding protein [Candidatus Krumholzibacteria bacterium]|nr:AMP-binding protein [Candidatus Krumholzibacteria bacterium]HPD73127.1 AMP-binding protein [Candidatus Krumholzibacteria bacterium]HRY41995.1 AMP-binding protein [Candidatus Krumholzibacteria bacterium]